jgi:hypothetical protein
VSLLLATGAVGCGGSDSGSTTSGSTTAEPAASETNSKDEQPAAKEDGNANERAARNRSSSSKEDLVTPLKVSGGGSRKFIVKGGDNSIQEFGDEGESELQEVAEIVHDFYVARAEEDWQAACALLTKSSAEQLQELVSQAPELKDAGCAKALAAFTRPLPAAVDREVTTVDAGSFRREGEQGFLIYYGAGHAVYAMPLSREGDTWKVAALSGTTLG